MAEATTTALDYTVTLTLSADEAAMVALLTGSCVTGTGWSPRILSDAIYGALIDGPMGVDIAGRMERLKRHIEGDKKPSRTHFTGVWLPHAIVNPEV